MHSSILDNDDYFQHRQMVADENGVEYKDNDERAIFYARGVLETVKKLRWCPDIIHCQGWISAFVFYTVFVSYHLAVLEIVVIVNEVNLHTCSLDRCYLDNQNFYAKMGQCQ